MSKFYVYGDVHFHIESAQSFLDHEKPKKVIWLGDFTDSAGDSPERAKATGKWLRETMLARPDDIFIQSNHDLAYRFPETDKYKICGWTKEKHEAFYSEFTAELWDRFVIAHKERWNGQDVWFSHAGLNKIFFPFGKFDEAHLARISKIALDNGNKEEYNPLLDHWHYGPMWQRWSVFPLLDGICQVVGHSTYECPQIRAIADKPEWNICFDCAHTYYGVFKEKHVYAINRHKGYEHLIKFS